jgi:predicted TIM-barrel fold metal-dependent hydrolase
VSLKNATVVDADGHIMEPATLWQDYIEPKFKERAIRIARDEADGDKLVIDGETLTRVRRLGGVPYTPSGESVNWDVLDDLPRYESYRDSCHPASYDPAARLAWMDERKLDISVLFPSLGLIWPRFVKFEHEYINAHLRAYNRWIGEFEAFNKQRLVGVAQTSLFDQREAIADLHAIRESGFGNIMLPLLPPDSASCFSEEFSDFWRAVEELGLVVHLHKVAIPHQLNIPPGMSMGAKGNGRFFNHVSEILAAQMCLASLMDNLIPDRFPRLRFAFLECNAGWVPAWLDRSDETYEVLSESKKVKILEAPPRHYVENTDNFFFGLSLAENVSHMSSITDRLLIATDFPHPGSSVTPYESWRDRLSSLSEADQNKIMGLNACRMLNLTQTQSAQG